MHGWIKSNFDICITIINSLNHFHAEFKFNSKVFVYLCVLIFFLSALRSSSPPVKLYKHRVDVTEGSGTSYGEFPADIAMSYKPIAPAPTGSNHTPPGFNTTQFLMLDVQTSAYSCLHGSHGIWFWSTIKWPFRISGWLSNIRPQVTITTIH